MELDSRIQKAKKHNALAFVLLGAGSFLVLIFALVWIFLIKGYNLVVGPDEAATNFVVEKRSGMLFTSGSNIYLFGTDAEVIVSSPTFESVSVAITPSSPQNIEVILPPTPAVITADLNLPEESSWFIDNNLVFVGNTFEYSLAQGNYNLRIENPFFKTFEDSIDVKRGEKKSLDLELESFTGVIKLAASVNNAAVSINQEQISLPVEKPLASGRYPVTITAPGYQEVQDVIDITYQFPEQVRNYQLIPLQAGLKFDLQPADGELLVDGQIIQSRQLALDSNRAIDVRYSKPGFYPFRQRITLSPSEQRTLAIRLNPANGQLSVSSNLAGELFIDGKSRGRTPLTVELPAITHSIELRRDGYRTIKRSVNIVAEEKSLLNLTLLTEYEARRSEGRQTTAQQLGIQMRRFSADAFTMGSEINQPGRRRNEHRVSVDFSRDFYVSVHEITEAQFAKASGQSSSSQLPKTNITWIEAVKYCNWLSVQDGLPVFYKLQGDRLVGIDNTSSGYRLPTEAEWEWLGKKANRQVSTTFVWGNASKLPRDIGNFADKSRKGSQPIILDDYDDGQSGVTAVGSFRADRLGLHDLAGNVSEWVHDFYSSSIPDLSITHVDYLGPARGELHVTKGGNYTVGRVRDLRVAYREPVGDPQPYIGFRIARYAN